MGPLQSVFERPPSGVRNPNTSYLNVPVTHSHGLAMPRSEPAPDEIGKHTNGEPVIEQSRSGAAQLPRVGEQFERTSLACVELTFFMQSTHRIALRRDPRVAAMDLSGAPWIVQGWIGIFALFG
jgi:hypothetical protein